MKNLKKYFLTGLFAILPIGITIWLIAILLQYLASEAVRAFISNFLDNYISNTAIVALLEYSIPLFFVVILIPLTGLFVSNVIGKRFFSFLEEIVLSIPLISNVYNTIKQIINTFTKKDSISFQKVGLVEYPRKGLWAIGFVTGETKGSKNLYYNIFIPTTPIPSSGYVLFINQKEFVEVDISVEKAMKIVISGGMISPDNINLD